MAAAMVADNRKVTLGKRKKLSTVSAIQKDNGRVPQSLSKGILHVVITTNVLIFASTVRNPPNPPFFKGGHRAFNIVGCRLLPRDGFIAKKMAD
jgi:hypothetical protein